VDDIEITRGFIRKEEYTHLLESKTLLVVQKPYKEEGRSFSAFFTFGGLAAAIGALLDDRGALWVAIALFVTFFAGWFFIRSFFAESGREKDWVLYIGSGDSPLEIFRSSDEAEFDAKRNEIERTLTSRPME
jgi:hypothetical protein